VVELLLSAPLLFVFQGEKCLVLLLAISGGVSGSPPNWYAESWMDVEVFELKEFNELSELMELMEFTDRLGWWRNCDWNDTVLAVDPAPMGGMPGLRAFAREF